MQTNIFGETLGPASQYVHQQKDPHQPAKPYEYQEYPAHRFHPDLGIDKKTGHAQHVHVRNADHEKQVIAEHAKRGLDPSLWRDSPAYFGVDNVKAVPPGEAAKQAAAENKRLKEDNAAKDDLIAELQKQIAAQASAAPAPKNGKGKDPVA